jgi:hypothetical protein
LIEVKMLRCRDSNISLGRIGQNDLGLRHVNEKVF